jgi:hypothetical protein
MHHKEIGQFVHYLSKYLILDNDPYPVKIEPMVIDPVMEPFNEESRGIRLVALVKNSRITIEIDHYQEDSNETKVLYYSAIADNSPSLSLIHHSSDLDFTKIEPVIKVLIEVACGKKCLLTLQSLGWIGNFYIQDK